MHDSNISVFCMKFEGVLRPEQTIKSSLRRIQSEKSQLRDSKCIM